MSSVFPNAHEEKIQIVGNLLIQQVSLSTTGGLHVKKEEKKSVFFIKERLAWSGNSSWLAQVVGEFACFILWFL